MIFHRVHEDTRNITNILEVDYTDHSSPQLKSISPKSWILPVILGCSFTALLIIGVLIFIIYKVQCIFFSKGAMSYYKRLFKNTSNVCIVFPEDRKSLFSPCCSKKMLVDNHSYD